MNYTKPFSADGELRLRGEAAINGLTMLIIDAVRESDDDRVTDLDRILQDIEMMLELTDGRSAQAGRATAHALHEPQRPYRASR